MSDLEARLRSRLADHGWRILHEERPAGAAVGAVTLRWRLASLTPPAGRTVLLELRLVEHWRRWDWDWDTSAYEVTIRFPDGLHGAGAPRAVLDQYTTSAEDCRQVFRALDWFRDPTSADLHTTSRHGDWSPPEEWEAHRYAPGAGLDTRWRGGATPQEMLEYLDHALGDRKRWLIACGLCRQLPLSMLHEQNRQAVAAAERYALGQITRRELKKLAKAAGLGWLARLDPPQLLTRALEQLAEEDPAGALLAGAEVVRELAGDPFRPVAFRHRWLHANAGAAEQVLRAIDAAGDYASLPVLADALEEAGCPGLAEANPPPGAQLLLDHCRQGGPHLRGCWAVDLLLGRK